MAITYADIRHNEHVCALIEAGNAALEVMGYTDHGYGHAGMTAKWCGDLLNALDYDERTCELARIAAYMHDIGNAVNRTDHAMSGATLSFTILSGLGMPPEEIAQVITAIGNHDEHAANPVSPLTAALILADKADVRRSRVRCKPTDINFDIHDRVNYAAVDSSLTVNQERTAIVLNLTIDTEICPVMDYFEIFLTRMLLCRDASKFFKLRFELIINGTRML